MRRRLRLVPAALIGAAVLAGCGSTASTATQPTTAAAASASASSTGSSTGSSTAAPDSVELHGNGGTVLAAMDAAHIRYTTSGSGANAFVTAINGVTADTGKHQYWQLLVNGQESQTGAGTATASPSDTITWKLATY